MIKKVIILFLLDIGVLSLVIIIKNPYSKASIHEVAIISTLIFGNLIVGYFLLKRKYKKSAILFFINALLSIIIFESFLTLWVKKYDVTNYDKSSFTVNDYFYELTINKKSNEFSLSEIIKEKDGNTVYVLGGEYTTKRDTIYLSISSSIKCKIYKNLLIGFSGHNDTIILKRNH